MNAAPNSPPPALRGVGYRRWVIVSTGLRQIMRTRFFQILLLLAGVSAVAMAAAGFVFTQALASGGWLESWSISLGPRVHAVVTAFSALVLMYPDICIGGLFSGIFWIQSFVGLWLSLIALSALIPRLITRDRASNALTIYLAHPLTSFDYLAGKLGMIVGVLLFMWTGPLLFGWALSMAFAPSTDFFAYSFLPLCRALGFNLIALVTLATLALAVSSLGKSPRIVTPLWLGLWLIAAVIADLPRTPPALQAVSFSHDLIEARRELLRIDDVLVKAGQTLPLLNRDLSQSMIRAGEQERNRGAATAFAGLALIAIGSSITVARKLRPE